MIMDKTISALVKIQLDLFEISSQFKLNCQMSVEHLPNQKSHLNICFVTLLRTKTLSQNLSTTTSISFETP